LGKRMQLCLPASIGTAPHLCSQRMLRAPHYAPAPAEHNKQVQGAYGIVQARGRQQLREAGRWVPAWHKVQPSQRAWRLLLPARQPHLAVNAVAAGGGDGPDLVRRVCTQGWCDTDYSVGTPTPTVAHSRRREDTGDVGRPARRLQRVLCAWLACCGRHLSRGPPEAFCDPTHASIRRARHPQQPARRHRRLLPPGRALGLWFL